MMQSAPQLGTSQNDSHLTHPRHTRAVTIRRGYGVGGDWPTDQTNFLEYVRDLSDLGHINGRGVPRNLLGSTRTGVDQVMAGRMRSQPSLLEMWQTRFKSTVKQYNEALDAMHAVEGDGDAYDKARDRERLLRGVVRGGAQMLIILARPYEANSTTAIKDLEIDYGVPGERSRPLPGVSPSIAKLFPEHMDDY